MSSLISYRIRNNIFAVLYSRCKRNLEIRDFDNYRRIYANLSLADKKKLATKWLKRYPEQAHFSYIPIETWIREDVSKPKRIMEIGGWRGDLASRALASFPEIQFWHNYDLLDNGPYQKCFDPRYKLTTLTDYIWNQRISVDYNALIATHMIEHLSWSELTKFIHWIPDCIKTVLFEAPLPHDAEDYSWKGDHSSHLLEKGWKQIIRAMEDFGFTTAKNIGNSYIFIR